MAIQNWKIINRLGNQRICHDLSLILNQNLRIGGYIYYIPHDATDSYYRMRVRSRWTEIRHKNIKTFKIHTTWTAAGLWKFENFPIMSAVSMDDTLGRATRPESPTDKGEAEVNLSQVLSHLACM